MDCLSEGSERYRFNADGRGCSRIKARARVFLVIAPLMSAIQWMFTSVELYMEEAQQDGDLPQFDVTKAIIGCARSLHARHRAQLINVLKATSLEVGLLLNFGPKARFKRAVYSNARKTHFKR